MAEGLMGALLGGEPEEPAEGAEAPIAVDAGLDPAAAALAMAAAEHSPELAEKAAAYFDEQAILVKGQARLVDIQTEHLHEQRAVVLDNLKLRRRSDRLKVASQTFFAVVASVLAIGAMFLFYDALTSHAVIIDPFDAPPALAADGLSGKVVAGGLLDELTRLQAATRTAAAKRRLDNDWTGEIKVEIPETGVSIGEVERLLRQRFGHDVHIGGDLVRTKTGGLTLSVRGDGVLPKAFTSDTGDLDALTTQAADYVYGESQPSMFASYLIQTNRFDEAIAFAKSHLATSSVADQPNLLNSWANGITDKGGPGTMAQALPLWRKAVQIKPTFWLGYQNIMYGLLGLGDEEGVVQVGRQMLKAAGGRPGKAPEIQYANYDNEVYDLQAGRAEMLADMAATGGVVTNSNGAEALTIAQADLQLHEIDTARIRVATAVWDPKSHSDVATAAQAQALLAEEVGDLPAAAKAWDEVAAAYADPAVSTSGPATLCSAAPTYQRTGQPEKADAVLDAPVKAVGIDHFVDCYRFRGDVLDLRGDWSGAQTWYAKAVRLAPDVPAGAYSWGLALARHGDLAGAAAKFEAANQAGPHWADPLKAWGDVLMRQGQAREALTKYDQALRYAPLWKQLHQARDTAAKRVG